MSNNLWINVAHKDEFRPIFSPTDNICPYYLINRYGKIISLYYGIEIVHILAYNGYHLVSLNTIDGNRIQRRVHRLVMYTFNYIDNCENLQVDHIFGDKNDNFVDHLEWVTPKENTTRAMDLNLKKSWKGELNPTAKINKNIVLDCVNMVIKGYSDKDILNKYPDLSFYMLQDIIMGNSWKDIITDDMIYNMHITRHPIILSVEDKHRICQWYQNNSINYIFPERKKGSVKQYIILALNSLNIVCSESTFRMAKRLFYRYQDNEITCLYKY